MRRAALVVVCAAASGFAALFMSTEAARAQSAQVIRLGPAEGCEVGPTDIPGVPVSIPADCLIVFTPSGNTNVMVQGELPAGFTLPGAFTDVMQCGLPGAGLGSGRIVVSRSGHIRAHCHIPASP